MAIQSIPVNLPEQLYAHLRDRAKQTKRSIEAELVNVVATVLPSSIGLPDELSQVIAQLDLLDNESLVQAARSHLTTELSAETERLHHKRQSEGSTEAETQQLSALVHQYERIMLVRARAASLLNQRGCDVSTLLHQP